MITQEEIEKIARHEWDILCPEGLDEYGEEIGWDFWLKAFEVCLTRIDAWKDTIDESLLKIGESVDSIEKSLNGKTSDPYGAGTNIHASPPMNESTCKHHAHSWHKREDGSQICYYCWEIKK